VAGARERFNTGKIKVAFGQPIKTSETTTKFDIIKAKVTLLPVQYFIVFLKKIFI